MQTQTEIDEIRRNAPLHYHARAEGARYAAWVLFELSNNVELPNGSEINVPASWEPTALNEAWLRERSFALESILKAAYAAKQEGLPEPKAVASAHLFHTVAVPGFT